MSYVFSRFERLKASGVLPTAKGVALEILRLSQSEDATVSQLANVLQADPALAGRLIKFANSTQGGAVRPVLSVADAVKRLGFAVVRQLCIGFSVLDANRTGGCAGFDYEGFWSRSLATGLSAQALCTQLRVLAPEEGFTCGLLADIGSLVLASLYPEKFTEVLSRGVTGADLSAAERQVFGADHLEFGAALLEDWRLPKICVDAVFRSEMPMQTGFEATSRPQMVCELIALSRQVGECLVASPDARRRIAPIMRLRASRIGIDGDALARVCDTVQDSWQCWNSLLGSAFGPLDGLDPEDGEQPAAPDDASTGTAPVTDFVSTEGLPDATGRMATVEPPGLRVHMVTEDGASAARLRELLVGAGHQVMWFGTHDVALAAALDESPDVMMIDLPDGGVDGRDLCAALRAASVGERTYIIGTRAPYPDACPVADPALDPDRDPVSGPDDFLFKPIAPAMLELRIRAARRTLAARAVHRQQQDELRELASGLATENRRLRRLALTDALTGLPNSRHAFERLEEAWSETARNRQALSCMSIGIDHFERVSTALVHAAGDLALGTVATILQESARAEDVICRVGGEEFMVICPDADRAEAVAAASRLRFAVEQRFGPGAAEAHPEAAALTLSIGVAVRDGSVLDARSLARLAEEALRAARHAGCNRVHVAPTQDNPAAGPAEEPAAG